MACPFNTVRASHSVRRLRIMDEIPLTGTGKVDYVKLKEMALS
ncbi:MAG: hypothetical protein PUK24_02050 [Elusimicrobia bacterium]|nr:hypothetical protein [Elusimicrobiota bacterium]MDY6038939.1 hypothetical protein [Elusimicrobiaceae bacterium]